MTIDKGNGSVIERIVGRIFDWKIYNIQALLEKDCNFHYSSPTFKFAGLRWYFRLYPCSLTCSSEVISLYLIRETANGRPITVCMRLAIQTVNDREEVRINDVVDVYDSNVVCWWGEGKLISKEELLRRMAWLAPNNTLTVTCFLTSEEQISFKKDRNGLSLQVEGESYDVTFKVKDRQFRAHKKILGAQSPVLASVMMTKNVDITDCDPDAFEQFLVYVYTGKIEKMSFQTVFDIYHLAMTYKMELLAEQCINFMATSINTNVVSDVIRLAIKHTEIELLNKASNFFVENVERVITTPEWRRFVKDYPTEANKLYLKSARRFLQEK